MTTTQAVIGRFRRDLTLTTVVRIAFAVGAGLCLALAGVWSGVSLVLLLLLGAWVVLNIRSAAGSRLAAASPQLIASGQYVQAESQIRRALESFSLHRGTKIVSLHQLAVLRHAQKRWEDAAALCQALLRERLGDMESLGRLSRLILADALLELGRPHAVAPLLDQLYRQRLNLNELLNLLTVQCDYQAGAGAFAEMLQGIWHKVSLAELLPTAAAGRVQALLALAATRTGQTAWAQWLKRRVELLLGDELADLLKSRPVLAELWPAPYADPEQPAPSADETGGTS